jgi:hypothetical protein
MQSAWLAPFPQRAMEPRPQQLPAWPKLPFLQLRLPFWCRELLEQGAQTPESKTATKSPSKEERHGGQPGRERWRDSDRDGYLPNDMASSGMNCMRNQSHEADGTPSVDQVYAPLHLQAIDAEETKSENATRIVSSNHIIRSEEPTWN